MGIENEVLRAYGIATPALTYGNGHINDTYISGDYIIQRINTNVFKEPEKLMSNILKVTNFLKVKLKKEGRDPERETLSVVLTEDGRSFYKTGDGEYFRVCKLIKNSISYDAVTPKLLYGAAYGFGDFQRLLSDFDGRELYETIPDFHNTPKRYADLLSAYKADICGRAYKVKKEMEYINSLSKELSIVTDALASKEIPCRVTHNDTKINNVLFDRESGKLLAVIDLDTVMPGSLLYDFGDALRSAANTAAEDEKDLSLVGLNFENAEAFIKGFMLSAKDFITEREKELLPFSVKLIALELGMRFLADYLAGDVYFKTSREGQNLDRARCQLEFARIVGENIEALAKIVNMCVSGDSLSS